MSICVEGGWRIVPHIIDDLIKGKGLSFPRKRESSVVKEKSLDPRSPITSFGDKLRWDDE